MLVYIIEWDPGLFSFDCYYKDKILSSHNQRSQSWFSGVPLKKNKKNKREEEVGFESFGWILLNLEFICVMGTVPSYLGNWGKRVNFGNGVAEILTKVWEREREKKWEREKVGERKFWISVISLPKFLLLKRVNQVGVKCSKCASARWVPKGKPIVAMPLLK